jgi:fatty acid-binding protein DegV
VGAARVRRDRSRLIHSTSDLSPAVQKVCQVAADSIEAAAVFLPDTDPVDVVVVVQLQEEGRAHRQDHRLTEVAVHQV